LIEPLKVSFAPNSFTPNNDGLNDMFMPFVPYSKSASLLIYDRWGNLIYNTNDMELGWDGKYKGENAPCDVYVYKIFIEFFDGSVKSSLGHITLIR
jgi:gliding motility-associated-like protein